VPGFNLAPYFGTNARTYLSAVLATLCAVNYHENNMSTMRVVKQFVSNSQSCGIAEALRRAAGDLNLISSYRSLDIFVKDMSEVGSGNDRG